MRRFIAARLDTSLMLISVCRQTKVACPSISHNYRICCDDIFYKADKARCRDIGDLAEAYPTKSLGGVNFNGDSNDRFSICFSTARAFLLSSNIRFVDFNASAEHFSPWPYHSPTQLMQPSPSSLITTQTKHTLQAQSADTEFLISEVPILPGTIPVAAFLCLRTMSLL